MHHQQAWNITRQDSHSQAGEPEIRIVSKLEQQQGTAATHILESQGWTSSAVLEYSKTQQLTHKLNRLCQASLVGLRHSKTWKPLTNWKYEVRQETEVEQDMAATHSLKKQQQMQSAHLKYRKRVLTPWKTNNSRCQQSWSSVMQSCHLLPRVPMTGVISRLKI